jgi:hypothetical protein
MSINDKKQMIRVLRGEDLADRAQDRDLGQRLHLRSKGSTEDFLHADDGNLTVRKKSVEGGAYILAR